MSTNQVLKNYLDDFYNGSRSDTHFPTLKDIYHLSKIDIKEYEKACVLLEYKTGTNQNVLDKLEFYRFNNKMIFLNEILEEENKQNNNGNESDENNPMTNAKSMANNMMKNAKSSMKMPSLPSIKMPKF